MRLCSSLSVAATFYLLLIFSGGVACGCVHEGAGVSRRRCGFDHVCMGVRVSGCAGVWVCWVFFFLFRLVCFSLFQQHAAQYHLHWSQHDMIGSFRSRMATFQYGKLRKWEDLEWPAPDKRKVESVSVWRRSDWNSAGEVCVIGSSMNIRSAWAGLGLHLKLYRILGSLWPARRQRF